MAARQRFGLFLRDAIAVGLDQGFCLVPALEVGFHKFGTGKAFEEADTALDLVALDV